MANIGTANEYGRPSDRMIRYFIECARCGVGLITSGMVAISDAADPSVTERDHSVSLGMALGTVSTFWPACDPKVMP